MKVKGQLQQTVALSPENKAPVFSEQEGLQSPMAALAKVLTRKITDPVFN
jgi:hypothetical protein